MQPMKPNRKNNRISPDEIYRRRAAGRASKGASPTGQPSVSRAQALQRQRQLYIQKQRQKKRRVALIKKRIRAALLGLAAILLLIGLCFLIAHTVRLSRGASEDTEAQTDTDALTETTPPPETEAIPPTEGYHAPNAIDATPITPFYGEGYITIDGEIESAHMLLMDAVTGEIVAQKASEGQIYPASMTKLMTVLVAYENTVDLNTTYRITAKLIDPLYNAGLSLAGFGFNEDVTVRDMLYGSALPSGADASMGLAMSVSGSEEAFVRKMNERAASLGMTETHFVNCTGEHHPEHVSSLRDIAILLSFIVQNEELHDIISTYIHTTSPTEQHPEGLKLVSTVYSRMEGSESGTCTVLGGKTGYTREALQCLATYARRNDSGRGFVCVIAGGETKWKPVFDTIEMYRSYTGPQIPANTEEAGSETPQP